jgi:hypothetical protein
VKVFWSWQSDTPGKTGRHFVRAALEEAVAALKASTGIEEPAEREARAKLHLDQDRQGIPGSPSLAQAILDKIDASTVVVADVTPVSVIPERKAGVRTRSEKRNMNPNVAIELGYALRAHGDRGVLMVLNTHYGGRTFLPFDLAHKAGPLVYDLPPNASALQIKAEAKAMSAQLATALRPYLKRAESAAATATFPEAPATASKAIYFPTGESLAVIGEYASEFDCSIPDGKGFYLRIIPTVGPLRPFIRSELVDKMSRGNLNALWRRQSGLFRLNKYGAVVIEPRSPSGGVNALTQVFQSGEIWGLARWLLVSNEYGTYVPAKAFEDTFKLILPRYIGFLRDSLELVAPYVVEAGAVGLLGLRLVFGNGPDESYGPFYDDEMCVRVSVNEDTPGAWNAVLLRIFEEQFRLSGYARPSGLFGFPPTQPA